jgi:hypothetical protein
MDGTDQTANLFFAAHRHRGTTVVNNTAIDAPDYAANRNIAGNLSGGMAIDHAAAAGNVPGHAADKVCAPDIRADKPKIFRYSAANASKQALIVAFGAVDDEIFDDVPATVERSGKHTVIDTITDINILITYRAPAAVIRVARQVNIGG